MTELFSEDIQRKESQVHVRVRILYIQYMKLPQANLGLHIYNLCMFWSHGGPMYYMQT